MSSLSLFVRGVSLVQHKGTPREVAFPVGSLPLASPLGSPPLERVLNRRLACLLRCPPFPGAVDAVLDTGAPLAIFPRHVWRDQFRWEEGRHFDVCDIAGLGPHLEAQLLSHSYRCRIVRLKVAVEVAGSDLSGQRVQVNNLIAQLPEADHPKVVVLGLWGGVFEGRRLFVERQPNSDDLAARFEW